MRNSKLSFINRKNIDVNDILSKIVYELNSVVLAYSSNIEGLGTKDSDIDIYVISNDLPNFEMSRNFTENKVEIVIVNGCMFDIEYWTFRGVKELYDKLLNSNVSELDEEQLKLIHRLSISPALYGNKQDVLKVLDTKNFSFIKEKVVEFYQLEANSDFDDAIAMFDSQMHLYALPVARNSLMNALGAYNAKMGKINMKRKWIFRIFLENDLTDPELKKEVLNSYIIDDVDGKIINHTRVILELTQKILSKVIFNGG